MTNLYCAFSFCTSLTIWFGYRWASEHQWRWCGWTSFNSLSGWQLVLYRLWTLSGECTWNAWSYTTAWKRKLCLCITACNVSLGEVTSIAEMTLVIEFGFALELLMVVAILAALLSTIKCKGLQNKSISYTGMTVKLLELKKKSLQMLRFEGMV